MLWIGGESFIMSLPVIYPHPITACVADFRIVYSSGVTEYECWRDDGTTIKFKVTGKYKT